MVKHIVMWKIKTDLSDTVTEIASIMKEKLYSLKGKIAELKKIEVGTNFIKSDASMDLILISEFESPEELQSYAVHPLHVEVATYIKSVVLERKVVDYIF